MVLNNKPQMFNIAFPSNFFYPEIATKWSPIIEKMKLPYQGVDDFMNAQIQQIRFPGFNVEPSIQQRGQYEVTYNGGKELEPLITKELNITFKLTESYVSYFILWDQLDMYLHYKANIEEAKDIWFEPITLSFISDAGFELTKFIFRQLTPLSMTELNLSYAATVASYNTFTWNLKYNFFDIV